MELTEDDVLEILNLFEQSKFDFLELQEGERKITVSKGGYVTAAAALPRALPSASPLVPPPAAAPPPPAAAPPPPAAAPPPKAAAAAVAEEGLVPVAAPMVGKFYAAPSPQDAPYVQPGTKVEAGATVGLIEVMKVFASVKTETAGVIERILVKSGDFVEFGQPLFLLRPAA
jgi:acetyl-CoA carboxylase biotin carboxyl carrier protein